MKTIFIVHCITGLDSAWLDRDVAEARARKMDMRVAEVPMPDYGDALPAKETTGWNGCPPGYDGGPSVPMGAGGGGAHPSAFGTATGGNGIALLYGNGSSPGPRPSGDGSMVRIGDYVVLEYK